MNVPNRWRRYESEPGPPEALLERLQGAIAAEPAPRSSPRRRLPVALAAIPAVAALVLAGRWALFERRPLRIDLASISTGQFSLELGLLCSVTLGATFIAVRSGRYGLGSSARLLSMLSLTIAPAFCAIVLTAPLRTDDPAALAAIARLHPWGRPCMIIAALVGSFSLAALTWVLARAVPVATRLRGAALGGVAGAWAGLALFVHCPASELTHLLVHVAPIVGFSVIGAMIVPQILRP